MGFIDHTTHWYNFFTVPEKIGGYLGLEFNQFLYF